MEVSCLERSKTLVLRFEQIIRKIDAGYQRDYEYLLQYDWLENHMKDLAKIYVDRIPNMMMVERRAQLRFEVECGLFT